MPKLIRLFLTLFLICSFLLATGATSARAAAEDVQFLGATFIAGKGLLVTLRVSADTDLVQPAGVIVDGESYALVCQAKEEIQHFIILACLGELSKKTIDSTATIWFGADSFEAVIKEPRPRFWCYRVFDFGPDDIPWGEVGEICQSVPAEVGDTINFHNPNYPLTPTWIYRYDLNSSKGCGGHSPDFGDGYYFYCGF